MNYKLLKNFIKTFTSEQNSQPHVSMTIIFLLSVSKRHILHSLTSSKSDIWDVERDVRVEMSCEEHLEHWNIKAVKNETIYVYNLYVRIFTWWKEGRDLNLLTGLMPALRPDKELILLFISQRFPGAVLWYFNSLFWDSPKTMTHELKYEYEPSLT